MRVHTFLESISQKVNVVVQLEIELVYNDILVQHVSHYTLGTPY